MLRERGQRYTKKNPGCVQDEAYLQALATRQESTGHLASFGHLLEVVDRLQELTG